MNQSIAEIQDLLVQVHRHMAPAAKPDGSGAIAKRERVAALASTLAFTIQAARR